MIELVSVMGDDLAVVNAARVSFNKVKASFDEKDAKLIKYLASNKHMTPFRHPQVSIRCTCPLFLARQLGKHQVGLSWNEVSRRYVDYRPEFYVPKGWRARPEGQIKQGSSSTCVGVLGGHLFRGESPHSAYMRLLDYVGALYEDMLASDIAPEMARMILPQSMYTTWVWTGSLLAFYHVYELRHDEHAQLEAREFAEELSEIMVGLFPNSWQALIEAGKR